MTGIWILPGALSDVSLSPLWFVPGDDDVDSRVGDQQDAMAWWDRRWRDFISPRGAD